jgi:cyclopropane fatty-acyl-phospholipid synthase-like methyltransferase
MQNNNFPVVCQKIALQASDTVLDMGCGWGTFSAFASVQHGAKVTGVTLSRNGAAVSSERLETNGIHRPEPYPLW